MSDYRELRLRLKSGEYDGTDIMKAWLALDDLVAAKAEIERLWGRVAELEKSCVSLSCGLIAAAENEAPIKAIVLRKQAEAVVPAIMRALTDMGRADLTYSGARIYAEDYAQRLRQQADEIEKSGANQ